MKNQKLYLIIISVIAVVLIVSALLRLIKQIYIPGLTQICNSLIMLLFSLHEERTNNKKILKPIFAIMGVISGFVGVMQIISAIT